MRFSRAPFWSIFLLSAFAVTASLYAYSEDAPRRELPKVTAGSISLPVPSPAVSAEGEADDEGRAYDCQSVYEYTLELEESRPTTSLWPATRLKVFPPKWRASSRRGLREVVTTLYAVHLKESLPILDKLRPPDEALNEIFRCRGFGERHPVDARLIEMLLATARHFKSQRVEIISGYRSPKFNDSLAKKGRHVAVESNHTKGQAVDFRVTTARAQDVGFWLWKNFDGGVGTYTINDFVHIDTGPKRRWRGR